MILTSSLKLVLMLILLAYLFVSIDSQYQSDPIPIWLSKPDIIKDITIRTQTPTQIKWPDFDFKRIYGTQIKKQIVHKDGSKQVANMPGCKQMTPQLQFIQGQNLKIQGFNQKPHIVYTLEGLKNDHHVKDLTIFKNKIYIMLSYSRINTVQIKESNNKDSPSKFGQQKSHQIPGSTIVPGDGFFFVLNDDLFFADGQIVLAVSTQNGATPYQLSGFINYSKPFVNVIALSQNFIAIAYQDKVTFWKIYKNDKGKYQLQISINIDNIPAVGRFEANNNKFQDIFYRNSEKAVYVLDQNKGIARIEIKYENENIHFIQDSNGKDIIDLISIQGLQRVNCNIMQHLNDRFYLSCKNKFVIGTVRDGGSMSLISVTENNKINPRDMVVYPDPQVSIQKAVFLLGSNSFRALYLGKFTEYLQNHELDKLYIFNNTYVTVNEHNISIGFQSIKPSSILCDIPNYQDGASTTGQFKSAIMTKAECNQQFIKQNSVYTSQTFSSNSVCLYFATLNVNVWQSGQVQYLWILWVFLAGLGITISCGLLFVAFKCWQRRAERSLRSQAHQLGQEIQFD